MMASPVSKPIAPKKSFASVAAMAPPMRPKNLIKTDEGNKGFANTIAPQQARKTPAQNSTPVLPDRELPVLVSNLAIEANSIGGHEGSAHGLNAMLRDVPRFEDEGTHLSSSAKAPSLDGKSVASGTTFAMDEKESLRPDDSASLKAVEEDESNSGQASAAASSRMGSEAGGKAFRPDFNEISERMGTGGQRMLQLGRRIVLGNMEELPQVSLASLNSTIPVVTSIPRPDAPLISVPVALFNYQGPDEKLLEAMDSPKDRLFLLQLEQQVISFIKDSQEPILDLPPCNSFCRLLAHRLGDYYALTHYVDNAVSAVRLYRTPYCRLPDPLSSYSRPSMTSNGTTSTQQSMKIMRRAGIGPDGQVIDSGPNTAASSLGPSKAGSETGDESQRISGVTSPTDSTTAKDKASMTREEREAKYKETRERIFGDVEETQIPGVQVSDALNEASRTSSATGKKKSKKNKQSEDDFQARSSYNAYWPSMQYEGPTFSQTPNATTYYNTYMQQPNTQASHLGTTQPYPQPQQNMPQMQPYQMAMHPGSMSNDSTGYPQNFTYAQNDTPSAYLPYNQQLPQQFYQPVPQQPQAVQSPAMPSPALSGHGQPSRTHPQMSDQQWGQGNCQNSASYQTFNHQIPYQQPSVPQIPSQMQSMNGSNTAYQYGQLPFQVNAQSNRSQHPLPGSYNRQNFNPQTRAFIPNNSSYASPNPGVYNARPTDPPAHRTSPSFTTASAQTSYGQLSNSTATFPTIPQSSYYVQPQMPQLYSSPSYKGSNQTPQRKISSQTPRSNSPGQSSLSSWARPDNLPPKPPPTEGSMKANCGTQNISKFQLSAYSKTT